MTAAPRRHSILPPSLAPIGVSREEAAAYIGVGTTLFDKLVHDGLMPAPRLLSGRRVWSVEEIESAFRVLPKDGEKAQATAGANWK